MEISAIFYVAIGAGISAVVYYIVVKKYLIKQAALRFKQQLEFDNAIQSRIDAAHADGYNVALDAARLLMKSKEKEMRADSVKKSKAVMIGKIAEQFAPFLPGWEYNPKDARFLGSPCDFIIFQGMEEGAISEVILLEIKTGNSRLSAREQDLQDIMAFQRVRYEVLRI